VFGKLMKYDMRSMLRLFVPMWCVLLVMSIVNRFTLYSETLSEFMGGLPVILLFLVYIFGIFAMLVVAYVFVVQRFYNGLLKDEGYLMFTLPVKTHQLIISKCLTAVILLSASVVVCLISVLILITNNEVIRELGAVMQTMRDYDAELNAGTEAFIYQMLLIYLILGILGTISSLFHIYLAMAIGHLANKHRVAWSVLAYIGINVVISSFSFVSVGNGFMFERMESIAGIPSMEQISQLFWIIFGVSAALELVLIAVFYIFTWLILKKKLNLE